MNRSTRATSRLRGGDDDYGSGASRSRYPRTRPRATPARRERPRRTVPVLNWEHATTREIRRRPRREGPSIPSPPLPLAPDLTASLAPFPARPLYPRRSKIACTSTGSASRTSSRTTTSSGEDASRNRRRVRPSSSRRGDRPRPSRPRRPRAPPPPAPPRRPSRRARTPPLPSLTTAD